MINNIKSFLRQSAVYSVSNVAAKAMGVILLPLYTQYISLEDFGKLAIIEVSLSISVEIFLLGQGQSILMFNDLTEFKDKLNSIFFTLFIILCIPALLVVILIFLFQPILPSILYIAPTSLTYIKLGVIITFLRVLNTFFLEKIRAEQRPTRYTMTNITKLFISLICIVLFVALLNYGIVGILYSYIIGETIIFLYLFSTMIRKMKSKIEKKVIAVAIKFGFPLIFSSIGYLILSVSDRFMIKYIDGNKSVALYDLGYRVAGSLNMFLIMPFTLSLMPSAYRMFGAPGDKRYFSKLMTYLCFILIWGGLILALFSEELIKLFAVNPDYWPSYHVVPIIILSYVFNGLLLVALLGQYLTKNTKNIAISTILAAILNIVLNAIYIPKYGYIAAGYTTLVSYFALFVISYIVSNRYYKISFEVYKLIQLFIVGIVLFGIVTSFRSDNSIIFIFSKVISIVAFPFILYLWKFYEKQEIDAIIGFAKKWKKLGNWKENILKKN
jgi:O-antigen/teichoic acid export membrane protein